MPLPCIVAFGREVPPLEQCKGFLITRPTLSWIVASAREVLVLYRKREQARSAHEHGVGRFRYSDLKEAARVAAGAGVMQIQLGESRFGVRPGEMRESKASNRERRRVAESSSVVR